MVKMNKNKTKKKNKKGWKTLTWDQRWGWPAWFIHLIFIRGKSISLFFPRRTVISAKRCGQRLHVSLHLAVGRCCFASTESTKPRWHGMWNYCHHLSHSGKLWLWPVCSPTAFSVTCLLCKCCDQVFCYTDYFFVCWPSFKKLHNCLAV